MSLLGSSFGCLVGNLCQGDQGHAWDVFILRFHSHEQLFHPHEVTPTMLAMVPQKQGGKLLLQTRHKCTGYTAQSLFEQTFFLNLTLLVHTLHTSHFFGRPLFPVSYHSLMVATVIFLSLFLNRDTRCCPDPMFGKQRAGEQ